MDYKKALLIMGLMMLWSVNIVQAGGGNVVFKVLNQGIAGKQGVEVEVTLYDKNKLDQYSSEETHQFYLDGTMGEHVGLEGRVVDFKMRNPNVQRCEMKNRVSDKNGKVSGVCYSDVEGNYEMYLEFEDDEPLVKTGQSVNEIFYSTRLSFVHNKANQSVDDQGAVKREMRDELVVAEEKKEENKVEDLNTMVDLENSSDSAEVETYKNEIKELKKEVGEVNKKLDEQKEELKGIKKFMQEIKTFFSGLFKKK